MIELIKKNKTGTLLCLIAFALLSRLAPHPANVTPFVAVTLFAGALFNRKSLIFAIPLIGIFLSDMVLMATTPNYNFGWINLVIYATFMGIAALAPLLKKFNTTLDRLFASLIGSTIFFITTNFAVWAGWNTYPKTFTGLVECYIAAIPFFRNMVAGDLFYTVALFGTFALVSKVTKNFEATTISVKN